MIKHLYALCRHVSDIMSCHVMTCQWHHVIISCHVMTCQWHHVMSCDDMSVTHVMSCDGMSVTSGCTIDQWDWILCHEKICDRKSFRYKILVPITSQKWQWCWHSILLIHLVSHISTSSSFWWRWIQVLQIILNMLSCKSMLLLRKQSMNIKWGWWMMMRFIRKVSLTSVWKYSCQLLLHCCYWQWSICKCNTCFIENYIYLDKRKYWHPNDIFNEIL